MSSKSLLDFLSGQVYELRASGAATEVAAATGTVFPCVGHFRRWIVQLDITASATNAGDTLNAYVDFSIDGTNWFNAVHFTQQAGNGTPKTEIAILDPSNPGAAVIDVTADAASGVTVPAAFGDYIRGRWTVVEGVGIGAASHTFSVYALGQP